MSYLRVIPRDLFNEANLLKCLGQVYLKLEVLNLPNVELVHTNEDRPFDVRQDPSDGALWVRNIALRKGRHKRWWFRRPLNSREPWPLYLIDIGDWVEYPVFTDEGEFTPEFLLFLKDPIK